LLRSLCRQRPDGSLRQDEGRFRTQEVPLVLRPHRRSVLWSGGCARLRGARGARRRDSSGHPGPSEGNAQAEGYTQERYSSRYSETDRLGFHPSRSRRSGRLADSSRAHTRRWHEPLLRSDDSPDIWPHR
jgi:hypothetical protein